MLKPIIYSALFATALLITACAQHPEVDYQAEKARIESECMARGFKSHYERTQCENDGRLALRTRLGDEVTADYWQYLLERLKIAADLDAKRITTREAELREQQALLDYQKADDAEVEAARQRWEEKRTQREAQRTEGERRLWEMRRTQAEGIQPDRYHCRTRSTAPGQFDTDCEER